MDFDHSPRALELQAQLSTFMARHVYPAETLYGKQVESGHRHHRPPILEELKRLARAMIAGQKQVPEPFRAGKTFQFLEDRRSMVAIPALDLFSIEGFGEIDVSRHEGGELRLQFQRSWA